MLKKLKSIVSYLKFISSDRSFDKNILEEYKINEDSNVYRLIYVDSKTNSIYKSFILERPAGMKQEDAFIVVSYVRQCLENINIDFKRKVDACEDVLIKLLGFKAITDDEINERTIVKLYFVDNSYFKFVNSSFYSDYFNWYTSEDISDEEIENIYESIGQHLSLKLDN